MIVMTGVSRGLGRAWVDGLIDAGQQLVGCARSETAIKELQSTYSPPHDFSTVDVGDRAAVDAWAARVIEKHGAPEFLVNNAALINANAPLWEVPPEEFDRLMDVNIKGVFYVTRAFLPAMIKAGRGTIVNLSSGWGRVPASDVAPYCTTKWAIEGMTQSLAMDLPDGLVAVPLNPGIINTEMLQSCFGAGAGNFPDAKVWAERAVPCLLSITKKDNGRPLTVK